MMRSLRNAVFVFGSNLKGIHSFSAQYAAVKWHGARHEQGEGPMGRQPEGSLGRKHSERPGCYAIPLEIGPRVPLPLEEIAQHVEAFKAYARAFPTLTFQVTKLGDFPRGIPASQIAPLFDDAPPNCLLPGVWLRRRDPEIVRLILVAPRSIDSKALFFDAISAAAKSLQCRSKFEVVVAEQLGKTDSLAMQWAQKSVSPSSIVSFPLEAVRYGQWATLRQNQNQVWYGTHLLAFNERLTSGDHRMIDLSKKEGLLVKNGSFPDLDQAAQGDRHPASSTPLIRKASSASP